MNPWFVTGCVLLQALLFDPAPPLLPSAAIVAIVALLAWTREHWNSHLDMYLLMLGPGSLAMYVAGKYGPGAGMACHISFSGTHLFVMTAGMLLITMPLTWRYARCVAEARRRGHGVAFLAMDGAGMAIGMALAHLPALALSGHAAPPAWVSHAVMLVGMAGGMLAAHALFVLWNTRLEDTAEALQDAAG